MIEVLRKIWRFAGEEQRNIRKSMVLGFFYAIFHMFQIAAIYVVVLALVDGSTSATPAWQALALLLVSILVQDGLAGVGVEQVHRLGLAGGLDGHGIYRKARQCSSSGQCQREHQRRHAAEDGVFEHERAPLYLLADAQQKFLF